YRQGRRRHDRHLTIIRSENNAGAVSLRFFMAYATARIACPAFRSPQERFRFCCDLQQKTPVQPFSGFIAPYIGFAQK
ncbi:hypothetical protein QLY92_21250, partial [Cronobacter dublinensis]|uniref:hypothetical protein n=1 Tax=Cronobacter dublinensis TaxID=413497 RepID=UPI0024AF6CFF